MATRRRAGTTVRCDSLIRAICAIERALKLAALSGSHDKVAECVGRAARGLEEHVALSESADGLLSHVARQCHHLTRRAERLRGEHGSLSRRLKRLHATLSAKKRSTANPRVLKDLLTALRSHHEQGTDLFFEAYVRDTGARD